MKSIYKIIVSVFLIGSFISCEDYLDKTIESDISTEDVFENFDNAQGFVEEMYAMIVDYSTSAFWRTYMSLGEDAVGDQEWMFDYYVDQGTYWHAIQDGTSYFWNSDTKTEDDLPINRHGIWQSSWAGIRKANIVIANAEELMVDATPQEIDAIMGQAYFFRAFFHHELMKFWGSMPYIDKVLGEDWKIDRPKEWSETALKIDKDFDKAIELLPVDWDDADWAPGAKTRGKNMFRITKGAALALKGKNLLYAASPLMQDKKGTYEYDKELCGLAAETFAKLLSMPRYELATWENYGEVFYNVVDASAYPYSSEYIFGQAGNVGWWNTNYLRYTWQLGAYCTENNLESPTYNYIHNYFGMNDGLSCDDSPLYDPNDPWINRDPRFYKWVTVDGDQMISNLGAATGADSIQRYAQFYNKGVHRYPNKDNGTRTGFISKKWYPLTANDFDNQSAVSWRVHVRLTDVYLMYAEAADMAYGMNGKPAGFELSAVDAINKIRERAEPDGSLNVNAKYKVDDNTFMDEIRREKAVELSWEGHRWMDVRRWKLGTQLKYKLKTELTFDRNSAGKAINFQEKVIRTKVFEEKHYWLPLPKDDVELYEGFTQNPGW